MPDVGILVGCLQSFWRTNYLIRPLLEAWKTYGLVVLVTDDPAQLRRARLVLLHYDCTRLGAVPLRRSLASGVPVLNEGLRDISKRTISAHRIGAITDHNGPVIVKSNRNYGGQPELQAFKGRFPRLAHLLERLPWTVTGLLDPAAYPIYDSLRQVPALARWNPHLVVEQFLPERREGFHCLRQYLFCGSQELNTLLMSKSPVIKARNVVAREEVPVVPPALRSLRQRFQVDYGRFDYVMREGKVVLFDVNKTPGFDPANGTAPLDRMVARLAQGILPYLQADRPSVSGVSPPAAAEIAPAMPGGEPSLAPQF